MKETETACKDLGIRDWSQAAEFVLKHNIDKRQFVHEELERKGGTLKGLWDLHHEAKRVWWERSSYLLQSRDRFIEKLKQDIGHKTRDGHHWEIECYRYSGQKQQLNQRVDAMKKKIRSRLSKSLGSEDWQSKTNAVRQRKRSKNSRLQKRRLLCRREKAKE